MVGDAPATDVDGAADIEIQRATAAATPADDEVTAWVAAVLGTAPAASASRETAAAVGEAPPAGPGAVCVRFVDDEESAELNAAYRGKEGPTNVLSFPAEVDLPDLRVWGDLVIAAPLIAREAQEQGKTAADHCAHLVVHGVLHLLGYDHQDAAEADHFEHLERVVLTRFGIADPYAGERAS